MIQALTHILTEATAQLPVQERYSYAELIGGAPHVFVGGSQWKPVVADAKGGWLYTRLNGPIRLERADIGTACIGVRASVSLRMVAIIERELCGDIAGLLVDVAADIRASKKAAQIATGASLVQFNSISLDIGKAQEFDKPVVMPAGKALLNIDLLVVVEGEEACFKRCK
jgi:hypothetical protein